ncbi:sigma 54-interacting transcriptional regulator [Kaarinaea lacus]
METIRPGDPYKASDDAAYFRNIFKNCSDAILVIDPIQNRITNANQAAYKLLGYSEQLLQNKLVTDLHTHEVAALIVFTQSVIEQGYGWTDELSCKTNNSNTIHVEYSASTFNHMGSTFLIVTLRDKQKLKILHEQSEANAYVRQGIAEWKRIENIFQEIEHENQLILKAAGEGIYGINSEGYTTFVNPAAERMLGWRAEELVGKNIHNIIHHSKPDGSVYKANDCPILAAFMDGEVHTVDDEVFWCKDGSAIPVEYTSTPIKDHGKLVGAVVIFRDISDRKVAEANLLAALSEVRELKHKLEMENAYLQEEISSEHNYQEIVGKGNVIQRVIQQIELVAPTEANVLVTGESGTGKELIARAIHNRSNRNQRPLIRVNCAAIPRDLFESEFFGHVKGSFTGAVTDRTGRFELADGGTLFLDEVGEIPLDLQSKLLRVLQESQFERVGENKTKKVNVRIIAATNRDLEAEVVNQNFREDLFFRLNVFPIYCAALRERVDDIPILAIHFLERAKNKLNKPDIRLTKADIEHLKNYSWPGNIRELQNVIERAVILSQRGRLKFDLPNHDAITNINQPAAQTPDEVREIKVLTKRQLMNQERENIINALRHSNGKVFGANGAAEMLGMKPTTLASKIKRYNLDKSQYM